MKRMLLLTDEELDRLLRWYDVVYAEDEDDEGDEELRDSLAAVRLK